MESLAPASPSPATMGQRVAEVQGRPPLNASAGLNAAPVVRVLSDRCLHGLPLGASCERCDEVIGAALVPNQERVLTDVLPGLGAIPTYVERELAAPHVVPASSAPGSACGPQCIGCRQLWGGVHLGRTAAARSKEALADLNAEVDRAGESARTNATQLAQAHGSEWSALVARSLVGVTAAPERARTLRIVSDAIELSARQGTELVLGAQDVLEGEMAKLFPGAPARPGCGARLKFGGYHCGDAAYTAYTDSGAKRNVLCDRCVASRERPPAGEVTVDALISGDPATVCRALWRGEAAEDGALAITALSEWVHGQVGEPELEGRFAELLSELLLVLGGPHSATS